MRNEYTQYFEEHPDELQPFPAQVGRAMYGRGVPPRRRRERRGRHRAREFLPAGQGAGAIDELVPAAELVRQFVAEAEAALKGLAPALEDMR